MLNSIFKKILSLILILMMISRAEASEIKYAGEVLSQDSLVFSLEEGRKLMQRMQELEKYEKKSELLTEALEIQEREILTLEELLQIKEREKEALISLSNLHQDQVLSLEKQVKLKKFETLGILTLEIFLIGGAIYLGDKIGDSMERN